MNEIIKPLLIHPKINNDEFLYSYLIRLAAANYYDSIKTLNSIVHDYSTLYGDIDPLYNPIRAETYGVLAKLCGVSDHELFAHTLHRHSDDFISNTVGQESITLSNGSACNLANREAIRRNCRSVSNAAFCPECLKESTYYRLEWQVLTTTTCLKHNSLLIDSCQSCGNALTINEIVFDRCSKCQYELSLSNPCKIEDDIYSIASQKILSGWMGFRKSDVIIPGVSTETLLKVFSGLRNCIQSKGDWEYLHAYPKSNLPQKGKIKTTKWVLQNQYLHRLNVTAVKALVNYPHGLYEFWDAYRKPNHTGRIDSGLGYLYWGWIDKRWNSPEYKFIQDAYNEYLVNREEVLYPSIAKSQRIIKNPVLKKGFKYLTLPSAALILNSGKATIKELVKTGYIQSINTLKGKDKIAILGADVEKMHIKLISSVDKMTASMLMGTTETVLTSLVRSGILESVKGKTSNYSAPWAITVDSITLLQEQIIKKAKLDNLIITEKKNNVSDVARQLAGWDVDTSKIISLFLEGKIKGFLDNENDFMLHSLYLQDDSISIIKESIIKENFWVSKKEFAERLGIKTNIIDRWVSHGLLIPAKTISGITFFTEERFLNFEENVINTKDASKILNVGVLTVQKWARAGRLVPISGPEVDGCHDYRFRKSEVKSMKSEYRISAPEMAKILGISRSQITVRIKKGKLTPISGPGIDGTKHYMFLSQNTT